MKTSQEPFISWSRIPNNAFNFNLCFRPTAFLCLESSESGSVFENMKLKTDTDGHGICGVHTLYHCCIILILRNDLPLYLCRELNFLNVQGTHYTEKETSTTDYNSMLWIIPVMGDSYSTGVDFNKEHLTLYISIYTNPFSKQGISVTFVCTFVCTFPNGYERTGCEGACFIKSGAQCYLQLVATLTK